MEKQLSKEASRAKYLYNKKYQDAYWERKAKKESQPQKTEQPEIGDICINRKDYKDDTERYIRALETSNRTLLSENRRIIRMLQRAQVCLGISI